MDNKIDNLEDLKFQLDGDETPREVRHAFEEVVFRNVTAIKQFSEGTRKLLRTEQEENERLQKQVTMLGEEVKKCNAQIANLQSKLYINGTD